MSSTIFVLLMTMSAGRKRAFNKEEALNKAMTVFWENGYAGTSLSDLTVALGINKPSMYAAFGNKEALFESALNHYLSNFRAPVVGRLLEPADSPLKGRVRALLLGVLGVVASPDHPKGCFYTKTCYEADSAALPSELTSLMHELEQRNAKILLEILEAEQHKGELPKTFNVEVFARYLLTVMSGLSVQAKNGNSREELEAVVNMVVESLPFPSVN